MKGGVALIIPVLEEGETIAAVVRAVPRDVVDEVIVVDGGSADDIVARAKNAGARVIVEPRSGYGAACLAGVRATDRRVIVFIDGDGSDDPAEIPRHARDGLKALKSKPSGGRQRENMSLAEERALLARFARAAGAGEMLNIHDVKAAYEKAIGHETSNSTVYNLLARHGWRKLMPRPFHPKGDIAAQNAFKKTAFPML